MRLASLTLALLGAMFFAAPASAQAIIDGYGLSPADRTRLAINDYSACILKKDRTRVVAALAMFPGRDGLEALRKVTNNSCVSGGGVIELDLAMFRGGLFTALYRERFGKGLPALGEANFREGAPDPIDPISGQAIGLREFGECVVRRDPATVHGIVLARVGTDEEAALYRTLGAHLGPCLAAGQQVKFSKTVLSGLLAEVLYRVATGGAAPAAGKD